MRSRDSKESKRLARQKRVRATVKGTESRPRLSVYKSLTNIYAQVINDENGTTLCSASTLSKELAETLKNKTKSEQAFAVGELVGKLAIKKGIKEVVFDRGGYLYTGRVLQVAEGARKAGLEF